MSAREVILSQGRRPTWPFSQHPLESFHREFDSLFDRFFKDFEVTPWEAPWNGRGLVPSIDLTETEDEFEIKADLPGVDEKDVEVTVSDGLLTLEGEKKTEKEEKEKSYYRHERSYGAFRRVVTLPAEVNEDKITARFKNGVLTVTLPKSTKAKKAQKKIAVKAA